MLLSCVVLSVLGRQPKLWSLITDQLGGGEGYDSFFDEPVNCSKHSEEFMF